MIILYDTLEKVFIKAKWPTMEGIRLGKLWVIARTLAYKDGRYKMHAMDGELIY